MEFRILDLEDLVVVVIFLKRNTDKVKYMEKGVLRMVNGKKWNEHCLKKYSLVSGLFWK